jgi:hypothetical protein
MRRTHHIASIFLIVLVAIISSPTETYADPLNDNSDKQTVIKKKHAVPFKSRFTSQVVQNSETPPVLEIVCLGTGHATHLGMTSIRIDESFNVVTGAVHDVITLTAANGDQLKIIVDGQATPPDANGIVYGEGSGFFDGGTGRFSDAEGSVNARAIVNTITGVGEIYYTGTIQY